MPQTVLLLAFLLACGISGCRAGGPTESITGTLHVSLSEPGDKFIATLVEPRPGSIFRISNWGQIVNLPPGVISGAEVTFTGVRLPPAQQGSVIQFEAATARVVTAAPPRRLTADWDLSKAGLKAVPRKNVTTLVVRPRLPTGCQVNAQRIGVGDAKSWAESYATVNKLQSSCTSGRLTYSPPQVTPYVDIPCTPMAVDSGCEDGVFYRWTEDALRAVRRKLNIRLSAFDHVLIDLPVISRCSWGGWGNFNDSLMWTNGWLDPYIIAHEAGHNYNLYHSAVLDPFNIPEWMPIGNEGDDSNLMGYHTKTSCFSYPHSVYLGLASAAQYRPDQLPPGRIVPVQIRTSWSEGPQGAIFTPNRRGTKGWNIFASYMVSGPESPYPDVLPVPIYHKSMLFHLSSSVWDAKTSNVTLVYRVRVLQSGSIFRWKSTGLVFKFQNVSTDGESATLLVCREEGSRRCRLRPDGIPPLNSQPSVRLTLPGTTPSTPWCLRACVDNSCKLPSPAFPGSVRNVYFTQPCPGGRTNPDEASQWRNITRASGYVQWVNVATGLCLTVKPGDPLLYAGTDWWQYKYRLVLEACNTARSLDLRADPQLFLPQPSPATTQPSGGQGSTPQQLVTLSSSMEYPNCWTCGTYYSLCVEACLDIGWGGSHCWEHLPPPQGSKLHTLAVAAYCGPWGNDTSQVILPRRVR